MTTKTISTVSTAPGLAPIVLAGLAGLMLLALAGFAQGAVLHDSAHDTRHAIAFPCH